MSDESLLSGGDTGGEPPVADPSTSTPAAEPAPFSFYGEDGINPGIQFEDSNKSVEGLFKKYQGAENPNKAFLDGEAIRCYGSPVIINCILWENIGSELVYGNPVVRYCDIEGEIGRAHV